MTTPEPRSPAISPRLKRTLELVYHVEGVVAARVWQWTEGTGADERVAVGIRATATTAPSEVLRRVEAAVQGIRQPGEAWEFGLLEE